MVLSPFRLQTYLNLLYLLLAFPLGLLYFVFLFTGVSLGVSLLIIAVGVPILLVVLLVSHAFAAFERLSARYLLSVEVDSPGYPFLDADDEFEQVRSLVLSLETYKAVSFLAVKSIVAFVSFMVLTMLFSFGIALILTPLYYDQPNVFVGIRTGGEPVHLTSSFHLPWNELLVGLEFAFTIVDWEVTTLREALAVSGVGVLFLIASFATLNAFAWLFGRCSRLLLGPAERSPREFVRARTGE